MPSSVINYFYYDERTKSLKIIFVTGMVYRYKKVPHRIFEMFKQAESKGKYFNEFIKDKYSFHKVGEV